MVASTPSTITLKGDPIRKQRDAGGAITPGHLLQRDSDGDVTVHGTAGGNAAALFALENDIAGDGIDVAYADQEAVEMALFRPGDEVFAFLEDGETAVIGSFLESSGSGTLKVVDFVSDSGGGESDRSHSIVAQALEAVDLSASSNLTADARIIVEIV